MALAYEGNTSLAFDTTALRQYGSEYGNIAGDLRAMSDKLEACLKELTDSGWTSPAGTAFHKMVNTNWRDNIEKYAALLDTLNSILQNAALQYESLVDNSIEGIRF
jgi:WXG100 family type VII secretion target